MLYTYCEHRYFRVDTFLQFYENWHFRVDINSRFKNIWPFYHESNFHDVHIFAKNLYVHRIIVLTKKELWLSPFWSALCYCLYVHWYTCYMLDVSRLNVCYHTTGYSGMILFGTDIDCN